MRVCSIIQDGAVFPAIAQDGRALPLPVATPLKELIAAPDGAQRLNAAKASASDGAWIPEDKITYALPVANPGKFICLGLNYRDHAAEGGHPIPDYPALFMRPTTSLVAHGQPLIRPKASDRFDYEAELLIVIGSACRHVSEDSALDHIYGYSIFNDGSVRDYQRKSTQWTAGKSFDSSGSFGPTIVTADELPAGAHGLRVTCSLNGNIVQDGNTSDMIFSVPRAIALLSEIMTLEPGDLIAMGTPAGVGFARKPPLWMKAGDICTVEIEGIGRLVNRVEDESGTR